MEPEALKEFEKLSKVMYHVKSYDTSIDNSKPDLFIVNVEKKSKETRIAEILESFKIFDGIYKREEIDDAIHLKEEITPSLIEILEKVLADPHKYVENEELFEHIYAIMLLGHFREPKAHKVIIDLFILPDDLPYRLFGDTYSDGLPTLLKNTCEGSLEQIKTIILNREINLYCRTAAAHSIAYAVIEGYISREDALTFLGSLFTKNEADKNSDFWELLAIIVCDLYPVEIMDKIRKAVDEELIVENLISLEEIEQALETGKEQCLEKLKKDMQRNSLDDIHASMSHWACFRDKSKTSSIPAIATAPSDGSLFTPKPKKSPKKKALSKKKTKQAKASKKKNRRK
ncbi:MAG: DUF1186 domain-containing protein [Desulfamplus sp.]|nr:DUF1186 domain-containing protein [Desulfamplus sp.]